MKKQKESNVEMVSLDGYKAASIEIERIMKSNFETRTKSQRSVNRRSASYREGFCDAILTAHCLLVFGEYPEFNRDIIAAILEKKTGC